MGDARLPSHLPVVRGHPDHELELVHAGVSRGPLLRPDIAAAAGLVERRGSGFGWRRSQGGSQDEHSVFGARSLGRADRDRGRGRPARAGRHGERRSRLPGAASDDRRGLPRRPGHPHRQPGAGRRPGYRQRGRVDLVEVEGMLRAGCGSRCRPPWSRSCART